MVERTHVHVLRIRHRPPQLRLGLPPDADVRVGQPGPNAASPATGCWQWSRQPSSPLIEDICEATGLHPTRCGPSRHVGGSRQGHRTPGAARAAAARRGSAKEAGALAGVEPFTLRSSWRRRTPDSAARRGSGRMGLDRPFRQGGRRPRRGRLSGEATPRGARILRRGVPGGDAIVLQQCPYASLVADNPVICDIHAGIAREISIVPARKSR